MLRLTIYSESRQKFVNTELNHSIFSYLDLQLLPDKFGVQAFWKKVLIPLCHRFQEGNLNEIYTSVEKNLFDIFALEDLFCALATEGWQFVLILDEFDALFNHQTLNKAEFYGDLRSLTSRCSGFTLIIASRRSLHILNKATQQVNPHASPYFNIFTELRLGTLPKGHALAILAKAGQVFEGNDIEFLLRVSGKHPYLLQLSATILWEINIRNQQKTEERYKDASDELYMQTYAHFSDTWNSYSDAEKKVITAIALFQIPDLVDTHAFSYKSLIEDISDYNAELRQLKDSGTVVKTKEDVWQITQELFLWWLADEFKRITRDNSNFEEWLCEQEMDGLFTSQERQKMKEAASHVGGLLSKGAGTLIENFAKGLASGGIKAIGL